MWQNTEGPYIAQAAHDDVTFLVDVAQVLYYKEAKHDEVQYIYISHFLISYHTKFDLLQLCRPPCLCPDNQMDHSLCVVFFRSNHESSGS